MAIIINYAKKDYLAKITELEGYHKQLSEHLGKLQEYKSQIPNFLEDENAQTTAEILNIQIHRTERTMAQVEDNLTFYRSIIEKLGGVGSSTNELLEKALGIISGV